MLNKNIPIIETNSASKNFGNVEAVSDINLTIQQGELMGLIGPRRSRKNNTFPHLFDLIDSRQRLGSCYGRRCG